ncbi:unnamed protein product [Arctogadus glacialis]
MGSERTGLGQGGLGTPAQGLHVKVSADGSSALLLLLCPEATGGAQTQTLPLFYRGLPEGDPELTFHCVTGGSEG